MHDFLIVLLINSFYLSLKCTLHIRINLSVDIYSVELRRIYSFSVFDAFTTAKSHRGKKMSESDVSLKWRRPDAIEYPKVWHTFQARDLDSDCLVEYRIEDVTQSNAKDVFNHMKKYYILDEPVGQALGKNSAFFINFNFAMRSFPFQRWRK